MTQSQLCFFVTGICTTSLTKTLSHSPRVNSPDSPVLDTPPSSVQRHFRPHLHSNRLDSRGEIHDSGFSGVESLLTCKGTTRLTRDGLPSNLKAEMWSQTRLGAGLENDKESRRGLQSLPQFLLAPNF
ncbi:hypothetical protein T439DRAFT_325186 [Meredithblackwellia eburnea MCA 4105]